MSRSKIRQAQAGLLADELRAHQGQTPTIEVVGKQYSFRKLKRKKCQKVLYSLVVPFLRTALKITGMEEFTLDKLLQGKIAIKLDPGKVTMTTVLEVIEALLFDDLWALASAVLGDVQIDGRQYGELDDHEYYDDKQSEMLVALVTGLRVNYPHIAVLMQPASGDGDSGQPEMETPTSA
jgi:hypothetical protein